VLRWQATGKLLAHHCLKAGRAIMLCWIANMPSSSRLTTMASLEFVRPPTSIDFGTE
jgi:hypothetical protein